jgi:hypothetical protein
MCVKAATSSSSKREQEQQEEAGRTFSARPVGEKEKKMTKTNPLGVLAAVAGAALVAVGLLVLMLVVEVSPAEATLPGKNGKIAYLGFDGNDPEIYTIYSPAEGVGSRSHATTPKATRLPTRPIARR